MDIEVVFFPSKENEQKIIDFINEAKRELKICVFTFTNQNIAMAILKKVQEDKVKVRIITDDQQNAGAYSIVNVLQSASNNLIQCRTDLGKSALMHHKYVVIDDQLIATGSFNWTQAAVTKNNENLLLIRSQKIAKLYSENFEQLWMQFQSTQLNLSQLSSNIKNRGGLLKQKLKDSKKIAKLPAELPAKTKRIQKKKVSLIRPTGRRLSKKAAAAAAAQAVGVQQQNSKFSFSQIASKILSYSIATVFTGACYYLSTLFPFQKALK